MTHDQLWNVLHEMFGTAGQPYWYKHPGWSAFMIWREGATRRAFKRLALMRGNITLAAAPTLSMLASQADYIGRKEINDDPQYLVEMAAWIGNEGVKYGKKPDGL